MLETNHGDWQDEDRLAADIREAFGLGTRSADIGVPACGPASPGSSAGQGGGSLDQWSLVGQRLDDFEVLGELGRGGMGVVYRARQLSLSREVALKVLPDSAHRGHSAVHRFRTEAQAAARLHHTNIVPIYAQGEAGGHLYYVMELIEGGSLYTAIKSRSRILCPSNASLANHSATTTRLPDRPDGENAPADAPPPPATPAPADARMLHRTADDYRYLARLIAEVADALGHAHRCGVIHRDLKPQNLLVGRDGRLQITDFGLARLLDEPGVTLTGDVMGTPAYLSPEQIHADHGTIDHRTDIYSLGVTIYELLTLRRLLPLVVVAYVAFGWTVPGDAAWPSQYAPSWQGLLVASRHSGQLLLMSAVARCVLWYLSRDEVLLGLRTLLWPLRGCRIEVDRLALQVALTLYQVDEFLSRQPLRWQEVQEALRNWQQPLPHLPVITLQSRRFALRDGLVFLVFGLVVFGGYQIG